MGSADGRSDDVPLFWKRKKNREKPARSDRKDDDYEQAIADRLRSIRESGGYAYSPDERDAVEARLRRMWYGAKKEGSKAEEEDDGE